jgi:hypothetical protein
MPQFLPQSFIHALSNPRFSKAVSNLKQIKYGPLTFGELSSLSSSMMASHGLSSLSLSSGLVVCSGDAFSREVELVDSGCSGGKTSSISQTSSLSSSLELVVCSGQAFSSEVGLVDSGSSGKRSSSTSQTP